MQKSMIAIGVTVFGLVLNACGAFAADAVLKLSFGERSSSFTAKQLLDRTDADTVTILNDPAFGRSMN